MRKSLNLSEPWFFSFIKWKCYLCAWHVAGVPLMTAIIIAFLFLLSLLLLVLFPSAIFPVSIRAGYAGAPGSLWKVRHRVCFYSPKKQVLGYQSSLTSFARCSWKASPYQLNQQTTLTSLSLAGSRKKAAKLAVIQMASQRDWGAKKWKGHLSLPPWLSALEYCLRCYLRKHVRWAIFAPVTL